MPFFSKIQKYTVFQCKNKKKEVLSWPPLFFSPVKHLHASCFPTHNAVQDSRLFELWLHCLGERWEHCVVYVHVHTHQYHMCLRQCRCLLSTCLPHPTMDSWSQAWKYTKKRLIMVFPLKASLNQSAARESRMETRQPAFWQGLLRFPWFLAWTQPPLHMSLNGRMWLIH